MCGLKIDVAAPFLISIGIITIVISIRARVSEMRTRIKPFLRYPFALPTTLATDSTDDSHWSNPPGKPKSGKQFPGRASLQ